MLTSVRVRPNPASTLSSVPLTMMSRFSSTTTLCKVPRLLSHGFGLRNRSGWWAAVASMLCRMQMAWLSTA